ncbi:hypothetical protein ACFOWE_19590 [Planomonospora corallina]|uniref:Ig-like domain-containing protein n=1 Tax=Planomonospora corallina TaxID=1806052 RepID=A0ABV8I8I1_9ACTN
MAGGTDTIVDIGQDRLAGYRLTGRTWTGELGTWYAAVSATGAPASALRFEPGAVSGPAARDRVVAAVLADRRLARSGLAGLVPVADLVSAHGEVWLLTAEPAGPTVGDLLGDAPGVPRPDAGDAATVLAETAQTLLAVHAAGLAHGAVHPGTVVIAPGGVVLLAERGLADALHGRPPAPERDVAAWASLARGLAATWAADAPRAAGLLEQVAAAATTRGLAAARDTLLAGRTLLPSGFPTRERLTETAHRWSVHEAATRAAYPVPSPSPSPGRAGMDEGEIVTLLHVGAGGGERTGEGPGSRAGETVVRFGPGVPAETTAARIWRGGREQATVHSTGAAGRRGPRPPAGRRYRTALSAVVLALILAGAALAWLLRTPASALAVTGAEVVVPKKTLKCGESAAIRGVLTTNGSAGEIRYRWLRSDGDEPVEHTHRVPGGETEHEVTLRWDVRGKGTFKGTVTLEVLSPVPDGEAVEDKKSFTYRCR